MNERSSLLEVIDERIPDSIKNLVEFLANIVTLIGAVGGWLVIDKVVSTSSAQTVTPNQKVLVIGLCVLSISTFCLLYRMMRCNKRRLRERQICSATYYKFLHDYSNQINELERHYKKNNMNDELLVFTITQILEKALDNLSAIFECMTGCKVPACVKIIVGDGFERIPYKDAKVKTFVRSSNTVVTRKSLDVTNKAVVMISDNTDFENIVSEDREGNDSAFYQPDLLKYDKDLRKIGRHYKNTTPMWEKYYIGTVVVPIRMANKHLFYTEANDSYNILGFLCVDSLSKKAFSMKQKENYVNIMEAYSVIIYNLLSKYQFYLKRLVPNQLSTAMSETMSIPNKTITEYKKTAQRNSKGKNNAGRKNGSVRQRRGKK